MTAQGHPATRFRRAIDRRSVFNAELAAEEMGRLSLEDALALTYLYAEAGSPKYERAALRYLERFMAEASPSLDDVAHTAALLVERRPRTN